MIIPVHKKGPTADPDMYRPIALAFEKLPEEAVLPTYTKAMVFHAERAAKHPG